MSCLLTPTYEACSEPSETFKMEIFAKIVNFIWSFTNFLKGFILDVSLDSGCFPHSNIPSTQKHAQYLQYV